MTGMDELLTTRQLQDLLQVDRITIYRMLNDGRLAGFKVGGQWRFSRQEIERWLQEQRATLEIHENPPPTNEQLVPSAQILPLHCIQAMQSVYAEALDVAAVTVDLDGTPLTGVSNSSEFCDLILSTAEGRRRCAQAWLAVNDGEFHTCHAGLACINAPIVVGEPVGGHCGQLPILQPTNGGDESWQPNLHAWPPTWAWPKANWRQQRRACGACRRIRCGGSPRLLQQVADTFSEIGQERLQLLSRLQHIAEMSQI